VPIVFANVTDPVGVGHIASLAQPGGNAAGFMAFEFGQSSKLIEFLKQIAPHVTRVAVVRNPGSALDLSQFAAIQVVASSLRMELTPIGPRDADEIERGISSFAREPNGGLIVTGQSGRCRFWEKSFIISAEH
jgi:putative tryptophan/tyrosine transport system substrate-binding protein